MTPSGPQRHPAHRLWQTAAIPGSSPRLRATRPQDTVPDAGPWWAPANPGQLTSMSTSSSGPGRVPWPRAAPKSPSSAAAANRGLRLRTPADSDGFPSTGSREEVLRELRLSSPGHQRAPAGLRESRGAGRLPSVQALREPVNAGPLAQGVVDTRVGEHRRLPNQVAGGF